MLQLRFCHGTKELVANFAMSNSEVRFIENSRNVGLKGYNRLFGMAKGRVLLKSMMMSLSFPMNSIRNWLIALMRIQIMDLSRWIRFVMI